MFPQDETRYSREEWLIVQSREKQDAQLIEKVRKEGYAAWLKTASKTEYKIHEAIKLDSEAMIEQFFLYATGKQVNHYPSNFQIPTGAEYLTPNGHTLVFDGEVWIKQEKL
jgi:hypothetical protein